MGPALCGQSQATYSPLPSQHQSQVSSIGRSQLNVEKTSHCITNKVSNNSAKRRAPHQISLPYSTPPAARAIQEGCRRVHLARNVEHELFFKGCYTLNESRFACGCGLRHVAHSLSSPPCILPLHSPCSLVFLLHLHTHTFRINSSLASASPSHIPPSVVDAALGIAIGACTLVLAVLLNPSGLRPYRFILMPTVSSVSIFHQ